MKATAIRILFLRVTRLKALIAGCVQSLIADNDSFSAPHLIRPSGHVDSLTPARSALWAFGFAEFLSQFPKLLKSPQSERGLIPGRGGGGRHREKIFRN
jgi:hypothetical protein